MEEKSTFDNFMQAARENIDDFEMDYLENHKKKPDFYPLELPCDNEGIWWEMLFDHDKQ